MIAATARDSKVAERIGPAVITRPDVLEVTTSGNEGAYPSRVPFEGNAELTVRGQNFEGEVPEEEAAHLCGKI